MCKTTVPVWLKLVHVGLHRRTLFAKTELGAGSNVDIQTFKHVWQFSSVPPLHLLSNPLLPFCFSIYLKWPSSSLHRFSWNIFLPFALLTFKCPGSFFSLPHYPLHSLSTFLLLLPSHLSLFPIFSSFISTPLPSASCPQLCILPHLFFLLLLSPPHTQSLPLPLQPIKLCIAP